MIATHQGAEASRRSALPGPGAPVLRHIVIAIAIAVSAMLAAACRPSEPLTVAAIQTGKSLNSDNSIATHSISFRSSDTMYVSVLTAARGSGTIAVRWKFGGQTVNEVSKDVSYNDQSATDFRFQTADGFPVGTYTIEVLLDGKPVGERTVRVE